MHDKLSRISTNAHLDIERSFIETAKQGRRPVAHDAGEAGDAGKICVWAEFRREELIWRLGFLSLPTLDAREQGGAGVQAGPALFR